MSFEDDLTAPVVRDEIDVDVVLGSSLYTLRFRAMDGLAWAKECDKYPMRGGVAFDETYGFDIRALTVGVAPMCGVRVEDGKEIPLKVQLPNPQNPLGQVVDEWRDLFARIDGQTFRRISDALFELNEWRPQEAVKAAKKALADSETASEPPSDSESLPADSSAGSHNEPPSTSTTATDA